jgi:hypothetical protein
MKTLFFIFLMFLFFMLYLAFKALKFIRRFLGVNMNYQQPRRPDYNEPDSASQVQGGDVVYSKEDIVVLKGDAKDK